MRVTTAFNGVLNLPGAWLASVAFTDAGIVLGLRRRGTWLTCPCGWCAAALRSRIPAHETLVRRIRKHFDAIVAAVQLGLSNSRLEGINAKIRLIQRRGYGHANLDNLIAMIYLCLGGITITLPSQADG